MRTLNYGKYCLVFLLLLGALPHFCQAQLKYSKRLMYSAGGGFYNEFLLSRVSYKEQGIGFPPVITRTISVSVASFAMDARFNVLEIGNALSIAPETGFSIGFGVTVPEGGTTGNYGFGTLSIPGLLTFNLGTSATQETDFPVGLVFGLGWEGNVTPIINTEPEPLKQSPRFWIIPAYKIGLRFNAVGLPAEINIRYGVQQQADVFYDQNGSPMVFRAGGFHWNLMVGLNGKKKEKKDFRP